MEDLLHCRDLFDPIDVTTCYDDVLFLNLQNLKKMDEKDWVKLKAKTLGTIRQWIDISIFNHVSKETNPYEL